MQRLPATLRDLFRRFHGRRAGKIRVGDFYVPKSLILLGRAVAVVYETDKRNGGGDGMLAEYIHEFETPVALFMDERAGKQLYLIGNRVRVSEAGIEN